MFKEQIGRNVEMYVDDLLVKNKDLEGHTNNLREAFTALRKVRDETRTYEIRFRSMIGEIPHVHGLKKGHRS